MNTKALIVSSIALALMFNASVAFADASDKGDEGRSGSGQQTEDKSSNRDSWVTTYPDKKDTSVKKVTKMPKNFTSREQGGNAAKNDCGCTKGGSSSKGKTGGDMGY